MTILGKLAKIAQLVERRFARIIARVLGPEFLSPSEKAAIGDEPLPRPERVVDEAFETGKQLHADSAYTPVSEVPSDSLHAVKESAAVLTRELGNDLMSRLKMTAEAMARGEIPDSSIAAALRAATGDRARDWEKLVSSKTDSARQAGYLAHVKSVSGDDAEVFKRPAPGACAWCLALHLGPDGHPRIFKLSELEANGLDNTGRSKSEWLPVVGSTHPHCACVVVEMPKGWGFDESGNISPSGTFGMRMAKSLSPEIAAADSRMGDRAVRTGVSGPNLVFQSPAPAVSGTPNDLRDMMEDWVAHMDESPIVRRDFLTYVFADPSEVPQRSRVHEFEDVLDRLDVPEPAHLKETRDWIQARLDRRLKLNEVPGYSLLRNK